MSCVYDCVYSCSSTKVPPLARHAGFHLSMLHVDFMHSDLLGVGGWLLATALYEMRLPLWPWLLLALAEHWLLLWSSSVAPAASSLVALAASSTCRAADKRILWFRCKHHLRGQPPVCVHQRLLANALLVMARWRATFVYVTMMYTRHVTILYTLHVA